MLQKPCSSLCNSKLIDWFICQIFSRGLHFKFFNLVHFVSYIICRISYNLVHFVSYIICRISYNLVHFVSYIICRISYNTGSKLILSGEIYQYFICSIIRLKQSLHHYILLHANEDHFLLSVFLFCLRCNYIT